MKFLIGTIFLVLTVVFLFVTAYTVYLGVTESWIWFLVGLPIGISTVICGLITSVGLSVPFED